MKKAEVLREIRRVAGVVGDDIAGHASRSRMAGGLASEGYLGGYRDALEDILLRIGSGVPSSRWGNWLQRVEIKEGGIRA